jgi:hypothetical protein
MPVVMPTLGALRVAGRVQGTGSQSAGWHMAAFVADRARGGRR